MNLKDRIEKLERQIAEMEKQNSTFYDPFELHTAINALRNGNRKPLQEYYQRGGRIMQGASR